MNNIYHCAYCNSKLKKYKTTLSWNKWWKCDKHKIKVLFYYEDNELNTICIESLDSNYILYIRFDENKAYLFYDNDEHIEIPIDPNLTPENFLNKVKTYMNFQ
jgi:hypothetical protein